jgi:hypothetical protein
VRSISLHDKILTQSRRSADIMKNILQPEKKGVWDGRLCANEPGRPADDRRNTVNRDAVSDYLEAGDRIDRKTGPALIDASDGFMTRRFSPLTCLIIITLLSLALWAAIWFAFRSLL